MTRNGIQHDEVLGILLISEGRNCVIVHPHPQLSEDRRWWPKVDMNKQVLGRLWHA